MAYEWKIDSYQKVVDDAKWEAHPYRQQCGCRQRVSNMSLCGRFHVASGKEHRSASQNYSSDRCSKSSEGRGAESDGGQADQCGSKSYYEDLSSFSDCL